MDVRVLDMPLLDTRQGEGLIGRFVGDIVLQILSFVAETERQKIKERQAQGIAAAKARGVRFGRPRKALPENFAELAELYRQGRLSLREAAAEAGMTKNTFWRATGGARHVRSTSAMTAQVDSHAKVRDYLALPPAERYARRGELTKEEHKIARKLFMGGAS